jgi:hypothetical protein
MKQEVLVAEPKISIGKRILKGLPIGIISLMALCFVAHAIWRYSGSNQWRLIAEQNGAKVYALKQPGSDLEQFKGVVRVHSSLSGIVAWLQDPDTCRDANCDDPNTIENVDDQLQYVSYRFRMPGLFQAREFVIRARFHQIPRTKELWAEYAAVPDKAPPTTGSLRVTNMNNTWRATPLGNGEVELEYAMNMDWGGFFPDVLSNVVRPQYLLMQLQKMQGYLDRPKFKAAKYDFIKEPDAPPAAARNGSGLSQLGQATR